ncbi:hypothetical protein ROZALSC1DRAFT_26268 [Rozella allomycis CSF55]|uniref:Uncharacterized protein n=1 Tax=Rozella allomycis (strain CSF55) TaxID=988480 RepID=A0A4P9Y9V8_ROZAC|nr:hypothetical protein ROZALSC1DRAFT_26268 [Rozella allomycis CSF55]
MLYTANEDVFNNLEFSDNNEHNFKNDIRNFSLDLIRKYLLRHPSLLPLTLPEFYRHYTIVYSKSNHCIVGKDGSIAKRLINKVHVLRTYWLSPLQGENYYCQQLMWKKPCSIDSIYECARSAYKFGEATFKEACRKYIPEAINNEIYNGAYVIDDNEIYWQELADLLGISLQDAKMLNTQID